MSTSLVHVLTIVGDAAAAVESACDDLLARRVEHDPKSYGTDDWSEADHRDIDRLFLKLIGAALRLPVHYYAQHLDGWSMGGHSLPPLEWPDGKRRLICGDTFDVAYFSSRDRADLLAQLKRFRRTRSYRERAEARWSLDRIKDATEAAVWLPTPALVVSLWQCVAATRHDEDIRSALNQPVAGWYDEGPSDLRSLGAATARPTTSVIRGITDPGA